MATKVYKHGATLFLEIDGDSIPKAVNYPDFYGETAGIVIHDALRTPGSNKIKFHYPIALTDVQDENGDPLADQSLLATMKYVAEQMAL